MTTDPDLAPIPDAEGQTTMLPEISINGLIKEAHEIFEKSILNHNIVYKAVLYSGGNDSSVLVHLFRDVVDQIIHCNTLTGIPETTEFAKKVTSDLNLDFVELIPKEKNRMEEIVKLYGIPGPALHNVPYGRLKEKPLHAYRSTIIKKPRKERVLFITGVRSAESKKRAGYRRVEQREGSIVWLNPIYYWTNKDMSRYRSKFNIPQNPVTPKLCISGECLCGAFAKPGEREDIKYWYPEVFKKIELWEEIAKKHNKPCVWGKAPNKDDLNTPSPGILCTGCTDKMRTLFS